MQILTSEQLRTAIHRQGQGLAWQCEDCGKVQELGAPNETGTTIATGYGYDEAGRVICYECCGKRDLALMIETGHAVLYLSRDPASYQGKQYQRSGWVYGHHTLSNWPGTLNIDCTQLTIGHHNWAGRRFDVWFTGPDGAPWHGVQYGDNTQICHCRRVKQ